MIRRLRAWAIFPFAAFNGGAPASGSGGDSLLLFDAGGVTLMHIGVI